MFQGCFLMLFKCPGVSKAEILIGFGGGVWTRSKILESMKWSFWVLQFENRKSIKPKWTKINPRSF